MANLRSFSSQIRNFQYYSRKGQKSRRNPKKAHINTKKNTFNLPLKSRKTLDLRLFFLFLQKWCNICSPLEMLTNPTRNFFKKTLLYFIYKNHLKVGFTPIFCSSESGHMLPKVSVHYATNFTEALPHAFDALEPFCHFCRNPWLPDSVLVSLLRIPLPV